jgi:hypothetical protein
VFVDGLFDYESLKVISLTIDQAIDMPNVAFRTKSQDKEVFLPIA